MPHRSRFPFANVVIGLSAVAVALTLGGCSQASGADDARSTETPAASTPAGDAIMVEPDVPHVCGQVSALGGIVFRSDWEHGQGLIDDTQYAARMAAVVDGWTYLPTGGSLRAEVMAAAAAAEAGGVGYDNAEFQRAAEKIRIACDEAGSVVAVGALPGQGG